MRIILIALLAISLQAKSFLISNIPLPVTSVMQTGITDYDPDTAQKLYKNGRIFSLLAYDKIDSNMQQTLNMHKQALNVRTLSKSFAYKLAFFMAEEKIGRYATSTVNSALATLLSNNKAYTVDIFDATKFDNALSKVEAKRYNLVIAPLMEEATKALCAKSLANRYYIPTQNSNEFTCDNDRVYFGGIDYKAQVESFQKLVKEPVTVVSNSSNITSQIDAHVKENFEIRKHLRLKQVRNLKTVLSQNKDRLHEKVIFLNLPPVSATLFLTQLRLYEIEPKRILSTQILYTPHILKMTQPKERENLVIANSIEHIDKHLTGYAKLLQNNLRYEWIDFTTAYGLQKFLNKQQTRQFTYGIEHVKAQKRNFKTIKE
ncbi:MAG: hypothetical protein ACQERK_03925 [Campylobacterota bacterium]